MNATLTGYANAVSMLKGWIVRNAKHGITEQAQQVTNWNVQVSASQNIKMVHLWNWQSMFRKITTFMQKIKLNLFPTQTAFVIGWVPLNATPELELVPVRGIR